MDRVLAARVNSPVLTTSNLGQAVIVTKQQFENAHRGSPPVAPRKQKGTPAPRQANGVPLPFVSPDTFVVSAPPSFCHVRRDERLHAHEQGGVDPGARKPARTVRRAPAG